MDGEDDCRRRRTPSEGLRRTSIRKVNGFPAMPHALDILAAIALILCGPAFSQASISPAAASPASCWEVKAILKNADRAPYLSKPRWLARLWARTKSE